MRSVTLLLAFTCVCIFAEDRTFTLADPANADDFHQAVQVMKTVLKSAEVTSDDAQRSITVRGTNDDAELASWLMERLDGKSGAGVVRLGNSSEVVGVVSLAGIEDFRGFQEVATAIRSVGEIRTLFTYGRLRLMVMRGTAVQAELAQWLASEMEKAQARTGTATSREFSELDPAEGTVAILYLKNPPDVAGFQNAVTQMRAATRIRRVFTYNAPRVMVVRATPEQVAAVQQMVSARN